MSILQKYCLPVLLFVLAGCTSQTPKLPDAAVKPVVTLDSSEIFNLHSEIVNEDYRIQVRLPASYSSNTTKQYPIIIKVDGQWDFLLATSAYNCIYFDGQMPETLFIGIDWANYEGNIHQIRSRDLLPSPVSYFEGSGNAKKFIEVLQRDILPQLAQRYRLNGQNYLLGGSWGAVFTTYALLQSPELFDGAIAIGGGYEPFEAAFDTVIDQFTVNPDLRDKRLYLGIGRYDEVAPSVLRLADKIESAKLSGLQVKLNYLEGFGHSGMNIPGYAGGYQFLFQRPVVTVTKQVLKHYRGTYKIKGEGDDKLLISVVDGALVARPQEGEPLTLQAKSQTEFYHPGSFYNAIFAGNNVTIETFFGVTEFEKISR
ncbi:putative alpha/beta superfamily hydrolase [Alteromonadaceae bacterium 2753L.S.0a.02]|nr:putative alpha/beta superfamily hydrolase [Alteromonadaceae bacterium 2753L.S.0a.02]